MGVAEQLIGLDIGTSGVRVAVVHPGPSPAVLVFGHAPLPPDAVRDGEIADPEAVASVVRRLWRETGLKSRRVRVAVATEQVFVRVVDLPAVPDAELEAALRFQAGEHIPIPVDDAVIGFDLLERVPGPDGDETARVLLVAVATDTVDALVGAVKAAGLAVTGVDLLPLAVARGLGLESGPGGTEALVSVGAAVTAIMIHDRGRPRMVRIVAGGAGALTEVVAAVRNSLGYYQAQTDSPPLERVVLTGSGALTPDLPALLSEPLGVPVELARPRDHLDISASGLPDAGLAEVDPILPAAVGIALGGRSSGGVLIDLLPPRIRAQAANRLALRRMGFAAAVLTVVLAAASVVSSLATSHQRDRLADRERRNQAIAAEIAELHETEELERQLTATRRGITGALEGDIAWSAVLEDLGAAIPDGVWLTSFGLQRSGGAAGNGSAAAAAAAPAAAAGAPLGAASFSASGLDFPAVARWLDRMSRLSHYRNVAVSAVARVPGAADQTLTFSGNASLGGAGRSNRASRLLERAP